MAVFDANAVVALFLDLPWSATALRTFAEDDSPAAPSFLVVEAANALWSNVRAGVLSEEDAIRLLRGIPLGIRLEPDQLVIEQALEIAIEADHPIYDGLYLALAERDGVPLITADRKLADISQKRGIETTLLVA